MRRRDVSSMLLGIAATTAVPLLMPPRAAHAAPTTKRQLFQGFAHSPGFSAKYQETKHIALLKQPIKNEGRVYFARPGLFARHVDKPFRSAVILKDSKVIMWDGSGTRTISLDDHPAVAALATSFLSLLEGNQQRLEANYEVRFAGETLDVWELKLLPNRDDLKRMIQWLSFAGSHLRVSKLELLETSGDHSSTRFFDPDPERRFSPAEKARYFSVPGS